MWVSKRFDLSWRDLLYAQARCVVTAEDQLAMIEELWRSDGSTIACLSVRSAFDLLLRAADFPPGSEIIFSAITIEDMPRIARKHGLNPIPVDIESASAAPSPAAVQAAINKNTRAIVVTHLYGGQIDTGPIAEIAHAAGLMMIEDCAQAFADFDYRGHTSADVSLFSFGPIKTATALGGALVTVRDQRLRDRMRAMHLQYPYQKTPSYAFRVSKYAVLNVCSNRHIYGMLVSAIAMIGLDHDKVVHNMTRGFGETRFYQKLRQRPCAALLAVMYRRLSQQGATAASARVIKAERLTLLLGKSVARPGSGMIPHNHWVFPILAPDPRLMIKTLRKAGFDATEGRSLAVVEGSSGVEAMEQAAGIVAHTVFLPLYAELPDESLQRMANVVKRVLATGDREGSTHRD